MRTTVVVCLMLLFTAPWAQAGVSANPTRPTFSDNAHPMAKGHIEFELGGHFWEPDQFGLPFLLKLGLADPIEFKFGGEGLRYDGRDNHEHFGFSSLGLFLKGRFLRQRGMTPAMGILGAVILPTASDDLPEGHSTDLAMLFLVTGQFGPMSWDLNTGIRVLGIDHDHSVVDIPAILALSARIVGPLGVIMEVADYIPVSDQPNALHLLGAITWAFTPRLILDFAFVKGFDGAPDWEVHFGFTTTLARLW
jgi:hypothetical protein